jgi:hypothetical protein
LLLKKRSLNFDTITWVTCLSSWRLQGAAPFEVGAAGEPRILVCVDGAGSVEYDSADYHMVRGAVTLLPAAVGVCRFRPNGVVTVLEIAVPEQS